MKKLFLLVMPLLVLTFSSCSNDDRSESVNPEPQPITYSGKDAVSKMKGAYSVAVREWDYNREQDENYEGKNYNATVYLQDASDGIRINWNNQIITFTDYECIYTVQPQGNYIAHSEYGSITSKSTDLEVLFTVTIEGEGKEIFGRIRKYESNSNMEWYFE